MGDFDFGFTSGPREPDRSRSARSGAYNTARARQGFSEPYDRSPVDTPRGWHGGEVEQTGGMMMVRSWSTLPDYQIEKVHRSRPGGKVEYKVAYGDEKTVTVERYEWDPGFSGGKGAYSYAGEEETVVADRNTDHAKAKAALQLMRKYP